MFFFVFWHFFEMFIPHPVFSKTPVNTMGQQTLLSLSFNGQLAGFVNDSASNRFMFGRDGYKCTKSVRHGEGKGKSKVM